ncbi:hypothetical protein FJT64_008401 [Amphibalanus amphitrite]|uniref:DUF5641 domain-containing protein n=1 Tax=Amphibalanus amphitrite TaxID=1232801 RepID=A0A6A4VT14_AMPAM|nr:hypothetical protein FJT64_008401 [Amphibalanus amphitrite]
MSVQVSLDKEGVLDETNHVELALEEVFKSERVLGRLESKPPGPSPAAAASPEEFDLKSSLVVRLPTFEGDVLQWPEFWELFRVAIHLNQRGLEALGVTASSFSSIPLPVLREKLPDSWRLEWARHQTADFREFLTFLQHEMRVREQAAAAPVQPTEPPRPPAGWGGVLTASRVVDRTIRASTGPAPTICRDDPLSLVGTRAEHLLASTDHRLVGTAVNRHQGSTDHLSCHLQNITTTSTSRSTQHHCLLLPPVSIRSLKVGMLLCIARTALVEAAGPQGTCRLRILLDGGSDSSYIRTSAADALGLALVGSGVFACMGFQERGEEPRTYEKGGPVDVLIGVDQIYKIVLHDQICLSDRLRAVDTVFGYVIHGREELPVTSTSVRYALRCSRRLPEEEAEQLWRLEAIGISEDEAGPHSQAYPTWSLEDQSCSPYLLLQTLSSHICRYRSTDPSLCKMLEEGLYMDDICLSFPNRTEAERGMERTVQIFGDARMELHKLRITGDDAEDSSILGLRWSTRTDRLAVCLPTLSAIRTKRELLSTLGKLFDPLGVLSPWLLSEEGILLATLRTGERPVPILPEEARITTLIVEEAHRRCFHQGTRVTLALLTAEYAPNRTPEVGDVVLVHNEGPRGRWPLARVTELLVGPDGQTRAAIIQLRGRRTRRPLSRLFRLEAAREAP